jgi:hypothetical protein
MRSTFEVAALFVAAALSISYAGDVLWRRRTSA